MGRERTGTWKYFHLSIAFMILISPFGCATLKGMEARGTTRESLVKAQRLLDRGDYEGSLKENQKALSLYSNVPPGDEALFNMGLIYAHYGYPGKDYPKSLDRFDRLVNVFPQSPLVGQAKIWIGILKENEKLNKQTEGLDKSMRRSLQESEKLKTEIEELNKTIKKSKQVDIEIDEKKRELSR